MQIRSVSVAVCAAVPLVVAGCAGAPAPAPPPAPPAAQPAPAQQPVSTEKVAWADQMCGLVGGFMAAQQSGPKVDKANTETFKASSIAQIDAAEKKAGQTQDGLRAMGPAPIAGGDRLTDGFEQGFGQVRDILRSAKGKAEQVNPVDQKTFTEGMTGVQEELKKGQSLNFGNEFAELERNPELNAAAGQAQQCKAMSGPGAQQPPR